MATDDRANKSRQRCSGPNFHSGVGLAASFADEISKHYGVRVGLIPCADGGTRISRWQPGEILYDHAVMMTKLAMRSSELGGIIWHQGENDCYDFDATEYKTLFLNVMTQIRKELNAQALPLIIGELSEKIAPEINLKDGPQKLNRLLHVLEDEIPYCGVAPSSELTLKKDGIHLDSKFYRELGKRYFQKYKELVPFI